MYFKRIGFIIIVLTFITLIYSTFFQKHLQKIDTEQISKPQKEKIELQFKPHEKNDLSKVPDSLMLIFNTKPIGGINGDDKTDNKFIKKAQ